MINFNKGCWMNLVVGIGFIVYGLISDDTLVGVLGGISFGYFICYVAFIIATRRVKKKFAKRSKNEINK